ECSGILPQDGPVNGNLRPDHDSHPVSLPHHEFVVWVVGQPNKIGAQFFGPTEQHPRIFAAVSASTANRCFFVNTNAAQKNRLAIEQNVSASRFDAAKTNLVAH